MTKQKLTIFAIFLSTALFVGGCKINPLSSADEYIDYGDTEFNDGQRTYLSRLFRTLYLWSDNTNEADSSKFNDANSMIKAIRYSELDKWSYSETYENFFLRLNQVKSGFGCYYSGARVISMEIDSPCEKSGIKRGDYITKVNYKDVTNKNFSNAQKELGVPVVLTVNRDGQYRNFKITPSAFTYKNLKSQILEFNNKKVGHIIYNAFSSNSVEEIEEAFTTFKEKAIDELIIDLRYNGGGSVTTSSILLDKIAGYGNSEKSQFKLLWNNDYKYNNDFYTFEEDNNTLETINRVFILTTKRTASASELVINALKPYMEVITVGSTTRGKPVGMRGKKRHGLLYWLISFHVYNANDEGEYFNGLEPTCNVEDSYDYERVNIKDPLLSGALNYISTGSCL